MTFNFAIGNTASIAPASNVPPSGDIARVLNPTALNGGTPVCGDGQLTAAGLGRPNRPTTPAAMMKNWSEILRTRVAPGSTTPAGFGKAPFIPATGNKNTSAPSPFNNKDARTWKVPGVPEFKGQIKGELMVGLDRALTPQRVQVFQGLSEGQQITARTLLGAGLDAMSLPAGSAGRIDPKYMATVVETALRYAQQTPTAMDAAAKPGASTPTTEHVQPAPTARTPNTTQVWPAPTERTPTSTPVAPATRSSSFEPSSQFAATALWSDQQISDKVEQLAGQFKITRPESIALMKDLLANPASSLAQRVNYPQTQLATRVLEIRKALNAPGRLELRSALAEKVGMPYSALAARVRTDGDATLGKRVMNSINPTHREGVAELLLTATAGSKAEVALYRTMDGIFHSGDPKISDEELARSNPDIGAPTFNVAIKSLGRLFNPGRISMLRTMGFTHVQILRMSAVGNELHRRFDPALGTYSKNEQTARRALNLPTNQEQAAERLLSARYGTKSTSLSYRDQIVLGVLSDNPWLMNNEMSDLVSAVNPNVAQGAGERHLVHLFQATDKLLDRPILRGAAPRFMDRDYRHDIHKKVLQTFGLGARNLATNKLQPIPTDFKIRQSPSPTSPYTPPLVRQEPSAAQANDQVHWRELLPLLQTPAARSGT